MGTDRGHLIVLQSLRHFFDGLDGIRLITCDGGVGKPPDGGGDLGGDGGISLMRTPGDRATGCDCSYTSAPSALPLGLLLALVFAGLIARHPRRRKHF